MGSEREEIVSYEEMVGEQNRGGQQMLGTEDAYHILGDMMAKSPQFASYVQKRIASNRPVLRKVAATKWRDWQVDFGPLSVAATNTTTITANPQVLFEGQRVMATDSNSPAGQGTRIQGIFVGQESQRPNGAGAGTLTVFFANVSIGSGIKWDTCQIGNIISVTVSYVSSCTFDMTVFGRAVK